MANSRTGPLILVTMLCVSVTISGQDVLDLTARRADSPDNGQVSVVVPATGIGAVSRSVLPLNITIEWIDRQNYREFENVSFRLKLQNIGPELLTLPWNAYQDRVITDEMTPMIHGLLSFVVEGPGLETFTVPVAGLYGSTLSLDTLKLLPPGHAVQIVGETRLRYPTNANFEKTHASLPKVVELRAKLSFLSPVNNNFYHDAFSSNRVTFRFDKYR